MLSGLDEHVRPIDYVIDEDGKCYFRAKFCQTPELVGEPLADLLTWLLVGPTCTGIGWNDLGYQ